jgi:hypothetical protein
VSLQEILVAVLALAAVGYLARQVFRTWSGSGCANGCCKKAAEQAPSRALIPAEELLGRVRQRSSERQ